MTQRKKQLFRNESACGGYGYRVLANDSEIVVQQSKNGAAWRQIAQCNRSTFDNWAESVDLFNPYNNNPALLYHLACKINSDQ